MSKKRHPRYDGHGGVWCFNCHQYLAVDMFHYLTCPSLLKPKYHSYCKPCTQQMDRARRHARAKTPIGQEINRKRTEAKRRQRTNEFVNRRRFIRSGLSILMRRGFTISEVSRLIDVPLETICAWRRDDSRKPSEAAESRVAIAMQATSHLPITDTVVRRRRKPHPEIIQIIQQIEPELAAHPMRSRWKARAS